MKIDKHTVAAVTYSLEVDGTPIEKADAQNPLRFLVGVGQMIPGFESQLLGKDQGESYEITVSPKDGYGEIDPDAIVDVPQDIFKVDGTIDLNIMKVGNVVPMQDQNGHQFQGTIQEIKESTVTVDFNHEMAGKTLNFKGEILEVRAATAEEIDHGHVHGPGEHHH
ncbi:MAG: peptidylprolyl isomerase [Bacteroidota bacterium]